MQNESRARGPDYVPDPDEFVVSGEFFLARFDANPGHAAFWIKEVRAWYAHAASDLRYFMQRSEADMAAVSAFLVSFRTRQGYDFMAESGGLRKLAINVLKRGKIGNGKEYEDLAEILNDQNQSIITKNEASSLGKLIAAFGQNT